MIEITNLNYNPLLKQLLSDYIIRCYEEYAILDDDHLFMEYRYLVKHNKLNVLFDEEFLINWLNDGVEKG